MMAEWANANLPEFLLERGPGGARYWQLLLVPIAFALAYILARLASAVSFAVARRFARVTSAKWDDALIERLRGPGRLLFTGVFGLVLMHFIGLAPPLRQRLNNVNYLFTLVAGFWVLWRSIDIGHQVLREGRWMAQRPAALPVLALTARIAKVAVFVVGLVSCMQFLGYPVAGLIAGLGVGGLAVALAAQKTLEHLLGSVMLSVDQPMRVGDTVIVDGTTGVVEQIGLRSTRLRTTARTVVTIPNGKLADARIENLTSRDRVQLNFSIGLQYETREKTLQEIIADLRKMLALHPGTFKESVFVNLQAFTDSAIQIEINACFVLKPGEELRDFRQEILFEVMRVVEHRGAAFAFPTRTIHMTSGTGASAR